MTLKITEARLRRDRSLPDDFEFTHWKWLNDGDEYMMMQLDGLRVGDCPRYKSGPRKGRLNYSKGTQGRTFYVTKADMDLWDAEHEAEAGQCAGCDGTGRVLWKSSVEHGSEDKDCPKCHGTGKAT